MGVLHPTGNIMVLPLPGCCAPAGTAMMGDGAPEACPGSSGWERTAHEAQGMSVPALLRQKPGSPQWLQTSHAIACNQDGTAGCSLPNTPGQHLPWLQGCGLMLQPQGEVCLAYP